MPPTNQPNQSRLSLRAGHWSDPGRQRQENEDTYGLSASQPGGRLAPRGYLHVTPAPQLAERGQLFVVADGMGGHNAGALASALAAQAIFQAYYSGPLADPRTSLLRAIDAANQALLAQSQAGDPALADMGTTVVAAIVLGDQVTVAHVGDSRCYLVNASGVQQITQDHTWVREQMQAGVLTEEEALRHPYRHVLSRSLGRSDAQAEALSLVLQAGDRLVLCSDGLSNQVAAHELQSIVLRNPSQVAAEQLVALANQRGGPDNITVVVVQVDQETAPTSSGILAGASAWLASLPRTWLAAGILGFAAIACTALFAISGVVGSMQGLTATPTKTPMAELVRTETPEAPPAMPPTSVPQITPTVASIPKQITPTQFPSTAPEPGIQPMPDYYIVQDGDTLGDLALKFGVTIEAIAEANNIADPDKIQTGQKLRIPRITQVPQASDRTQ